MIPSRRAIARWSGARNADRYSIQVNSAGLASLIYEHEPLSPDAGGDHGKTHLGDWALPDTLDARRAAGCFASAMGSTSERDFSDLSLRYRADELGGVQPYPERVSERMCKQVSVSLPYRGDSHDDRQDDYT
jgi:hypothetical protein